MPKLLKISRRPAGDTLVEVLISIALIGAVLAGSYALSTRSLREGVSAAEHSEAIKLVQNQIELLKFRERNTLAANWASQFATIGTPPTGHSNFCLASGAAQEDDSNFTNSWWPQENNNLTNLTAAPVGLVPPGYNAVCTADNSKYFVNISEHTAGPAGTYPTYLITVQWLPAGGGPTSVSQAYYRF